MDKINTKNKIKDITNKALNIDINNRKPTLKKINIIFMICVLILIVAIIVFILLRASRARLPSFKPALYPTPQLGKKTATQTPSSSSMTKTNQNNLSPTELIKGRSKVTIDVSAKYQKDQSSIRNVKSVNIPGNKQSYFRFIKTISANEDSLIEVPKLIFQQISDEEAKVIAKKFGFEDEPTKPDQDPRILRWEQSTKRLIIDTFSISYYEYIEGGEAPPYEDAEKIATNYLKSINYLPESYDVYNVFPGQKETNIFWSYLDKDSPYYNKFVKATSVGFVSKHNGYPISRGDISAKFYGNEINAFPSVDVWVGPDNKIVGVSLTKNLRAEKGPVFTKKSLDKAIDDVKTTGGIFMNSEYKEPQKDKSYCFGGKKCQVTDAIINNAKLVYYQPLGPPRRYSDDEKPYNVGYMIPMWLFDGEGTMLRTVDGVESYGTPVRFIAGVYAIDGNSEQSNLFKINSFSVESSNSDNYKINFSFGFDVPYEYSSTMNPRQGLDYTLLVLYPDNTYGEYRSVIYDPESKEELIVPKRTLTGAKMILYLTDFPGIIMTASAAGEDKTNDISPDWTEYKNVHYKYSIKYPALWKKADEGYSDLKDSIVMLRPDENKRSEYIAINSITHYPNLSENFIKSTLNINGQTVEKFEGAGYEANQTLIDYLIKGENDDYFTIQAYYMNNNLQLKETYEKIIATFIFPSQ